MGRYMCTWEPQPAGWPSDINERRELSKKLMKEAKQGMEDGWVKDWATYVGGKGYWILEGSSGKEVRNKMAPYMQYFVFNVQEVLSLEEALELMG